MKTGTIVLLVILVILIGVLVALYFIGKRLEKQQAEQNERIQANKQPVVIMAVDKKRLLIADEKVFDYIPINKQVKAMVSGIYIVEVKGMRGQKLVSDNPVKKSWFRKQMDKLQEKAGAKPLK